MLCAVAALIIANTPLFEAYDKILHTKICIGFGEYTITESVHHWINDGLMALFFLIIGLEIKREILVGELSDLRQAALPIAAAIGGMLIPAIIYIVINYGGDAQRGWAIPMATDIAFAVGILVILGKRIPRTLMSFLLALAIVDDLGAIIVIALFYTNKIHLGALGFSAACFIALMVLNLGGVRKTLPYYLLGILLWIGMLKSGVHATLAGVLTALTIPAISRCDMGMFSGRIHELMIRFDKVHKPGKNILENAEQHAVLQGLQNYVHRMETPLQRVEHSFHLWVSFLIVPLFALANAGIPINFGSLGEVFVHPLTMGVTAGLVLGKFAGVLFFSWIAVRSGISRLPESVSMSQIAGVALLARIGFTMSIFVAGLAFEGQIDYLVKAKIAIILASVIAGITGFLWLYAAGKKAVVS
jgi:Na+:H+ antiporter, NhaA family